MNNEIPFVVKLVASLSLSSNGSTHFRSTNAGSQLSILIGTQHTLTDSTGIIHKGILMQYVHSSPSDFHMDVDSDQSSLWQSLDKASSNTETQSDSRDSPVVDEVTQSLLKKRIHRDSEKNIYS